MKLLNLKASQKGFTIVEIVIVIVVIAGLAIGGKYVFDRVQNASTDSTTNSSQADDVPEVKSASDLKNAEDYLNKTDLDNLDDSKLDSDIDALL